VPLSAPVELIIAKPVGREGETVKVNGAVPSTATTGIKVDVACVAVRTTVGTATLVEMIAVTPNENVLVAVADDASVTVTV
jgi:acyl-CoA hydrolase